MSKQWDFRNKEHLDVFNGLLAPLVLASRSRDFMGESARHQLVTWVMALDDIPLDVLSAGVQHLLRRVTWMPRPGELRAACCDIVEERRKNAGRRAKALMANCDQCEGIGWRFDTVEGVEIARRCVCFERAGDIMRGVPEPIERPALPAHEETVEAS